MRRARVSSGIGVLAALGVVAAAAVTVRAADDNDKVAPSRRADQEALKAYAPLVGSWRGVGQVKRGRAQGSGESRRIGPGSSPATPPDWR